MKVSIALATYNGSKYIEEQLKSYLSQTIIPDELVVSDDNSTDDTLGIIYEYARKVPFSVKIYRNKERLGYVRNFNNAIEKCTGDIIFLSDQDDIWLPQKIERILKEFNKRKNAMLVMNDAEIILENGEKTGLTKLKQINSLGLKKDKFTTGCCMSFKKELLPLILPIPDIEYKHDTWINKISLIFEMKVILEEVLQYYRRHKENASSWIGSRPIKVNRYTIIKEYKNDDPREYFKSRLSKLKVLEERIDKYINEIENNSIFREKYINAKRKIIKEKVAIQHREQALKKSLIHRFPDMIIMLFKGEYKYFSGIKSFIKDIILD